MIYKIPSVFRKIYRVVIKKPNGSKNGSITGRVKEVFFFVLTTE